MEKYDCTEIFRGLFWRQLPEKGRFSYFAHRQMDGGQIFADGGRYVGRITWANSGKSATVTIL